MHSYPSLESPERVSRCIGDDWEFKFHVIDHTETPPVAANLNGYTPGGILVIPNAAPLAIIGDMVDVTELENGKFTLWVSSSYTVNYLPDNLLYSLQVYLINPINRKQTYLMVPLQVVGLSS